MNTTEVIKKDAQWNRSAYINLIGDKVVFDCSDGEYGPIEFDLDSLEKAIEKHKQKENHNTWLSRIRKYTTTENGN